MNVLELKETQREISKDLVSLRGQESLIKAARADMNRRINHYINALEESIKSQDIEDLGKPTNYERLTYEGRNIERNKSRDYCGCGSIEGHVSQVRDPDSWIRSSLRSWFHTAVRNEMGF